MSGGSAGGVVGAISINNISTVKVCMSKYNYGYPYLARALKERDHPFKTSANIYTFLTPTPLQSAVFLVLSVGKFGKFLTPPPLEHADVLNGWSQRMVPIFSTTKLFIRLSNLGRLSK